MSIDGSADCKGGCESPDKILKRKLESHTNTIYNMTKRPRTTHYDTTLQVQTPRMLLPMRPRGEVSPPPQPIPLSAAAAVDEESMHETLKQLQTAQNFFSVWLDDSKRKDFMHNMIHITEYAIKQLEREKRLGVR